MIRTQLSAMDAAGFATHYYSFLRAKWEGLPELAEQSFEKLAVVADTIGATKEVAHGLGAVLQVQADWLVRLEKFDLAFEVLGSAISLLDTKERLQWQRGGVSPSSEVRLLLIGTLADLKWRVPVDHKDRLVPVESMAADWLRYATRILPYVEQSFDRNEIRALCSIVVTSGALLASLLRRDLLEAVLPVVDMVNRISSRIEGRRTLAVRDLDFHHHDKIEYRGASYWWFEIAKALCLQQEGRRTLRSTEYAVLYDLLLDAVRTAPPTDRLLEESILRDKSRLRLRPLDSRGLEVLGA